MAVVMDGAIAADAGIITGGAEVVATTMVGGIIAITGNLTSIFSEGPPGWRPLSWPFAQASSPIGPSLALRRCQCVGLCRAPLKSCGGGRAALRAIASSSRAAMERICLEDGALCCPDEPYEARPMASAYNPQFVVGQRTSTPLQYTRKELKLRRFQVSV